MKIPDSIIEEIRNLDIVDVVSGFITLKKHGANYQACCPFHDENTPSFNVSPSKGIYKCFGCGQGGHGIDFVMKHENMSFYEVIKYLAAKNNIPIPEEPLTAEQIAKEKYKEDILQIMEYAAEHYHKALFDLSHYSSLNYVKNNRKWSNETLEKFKVGFCNNYHSLPFDAEKIAYCGLVFNKFSFFQNRITIPIQDIHGNVVAFTGRRFGENQEGGKYKNTPTYELYNKSELIFNLHRAKNYIRKLENVILVEGQADVISLDQAGVLNVCGLSGTALSESQCQILRKLTDTITLMLDADKAGQEASLKSIKLLLQHGFTVYIYALEPGEDPDSFVQKYPNEGINLLILENRKDWITAILNWSFDLYNSGIIGKAAFTNKVCEIVFNVPSELKRFLYMHQYSSLSGIPISLFRKTIKKIK